jgi:hypothetical protein
MGWLMCRLGRHAWVQKRNPEVGGKLAEFKQCSRCGKEQDVYGKPPSTGIGVTG